VKCECYCINCENGDHEHCEFGCLPEDTTEVGHDPNPNADADRLWEER
jgi:hypothetical protein